MYIYDVFVNCWFASRRPGSLTLSMKGHGLCAIAFEIKDETTQLFDLFQHVYMYVHTHTHMNVHINTHEHTSASSQRGVGRNQKAMRLASPHHDVEIHIA